MDTITQEVPTVAGTPFAGGFYAGRILIGTELYALILAPKADGEHEPARLAQKLDDVPAARSFFDGRGNTAALAGAGSKLAKWAQGLRLGGFDDWYLPARDELEILYRAFKPGEETNFCGSGDNPSSVPAGYAYSREEPPQTPAEAFRPGGAEAFEEEWYWSSTQYAGGESYAWYQYFHYGLQDINHKDNELRARAVRRLKL